MKYDAEFYKYRQLLRPPNMNSKIKQLNMIISAISQLPVKDVLLLHLCNIGKLIWISYFLIQMSKKLHNVFHLQVLKKEYASIRLEFLSCNTQYSENWHVKVRSNQLALYVEYKLVLYKPPSCLITISINMNLLMNGRNRSLLETLSHLTRYSITMLTYLMVWNITKLLWIPLSK